MMAADDEKKSSEAPPTSSEGTSPKKRSSSIFKNARQSFYRSGGKRGASVEKLRGTTGADFEATGRIHRALEGVGCGCFGSAFDNSDALVLIKGPFIFVFASETSSSPKYAISLNQLQAKPKNPEHGRHPVVLETSLGEAQYELSFEQADMADKFVSVVKKQSAYAERADIKKRLGHEHLLSKRASVKFAEQIANEKCKDAPPKVGLNADQNELHAVVGRRNVAQYALLHPY